MKKILVPSDFSKPSLVAAGSAHVLAGSIAEDVAAHSRRPVLTFVVKH